jgi:hypothetical protein
MTYSVFEIRKLIYRFRNIDDSLAMETGHRYVSFLFTLLNRLVWKSKDAYVTVCILIILYLFVFLIFFSIVIGNNLIKGNYLITFFYY